MITNADVDTVWLSQDAFVKKHWHCWKLCSIFTGEKKLTLMKIWYRSDRFRTNLFFETQRRPGQSSS